MRDKEDPDQRFSYIKPCQEASIKSTVSLLKINNYVKAEAFLYIR